VDLESVRRYCLSLPHATEDIQWKNDLLFRINGKIFATASLETTPARITLKCTPEEFADLVEREGIVPAPYVARNHWVQLEHPDAVSRTELKRLIRDSYNMVAAKLPKKIRLQLGLA
jgi:predicted DNA-binding protein (MmcQ/YjbR family)